MLVDQSSSKARRRRRGRKGGGDESHPEKNASGGKIGGASSQQHHSTLLVQLDDGETWYSYGQQFPERDAVLKDARMKSSAGVIQKYRNLADSIYRREVQLYNSNSNSNSKKDDRWVESTMRKGTLKDRIASMAVVVSTDPIHKFYALDGLLTMTEATANARVAQLAAEAIEDLFLNTFLPKDRKLLTLAQRPLYLYEQGSDSGDTAKAKNKKKSSKTSKKTLSPRILMLWRFEEMVKEKYDFFLRQYLVHTLQEGNMEVQKIAAVRSATTLLRSVPENEALLLQMVVNKLGDPAKKVAAAAGHELRRTLQQHPVMQTVVAREVQQLAHRPHLSSKALYNCIIFLNQLKLSRDDATNLAASLISTYFRLFEVAIHNAKSDGTTSRSSGSSKHKRKKKDYSSNNSKNAAEEEAGMKSRLLSALLTGVNRAHPYLPAADQKMDEHVDALYRVVHTAPPGARTQSLLLLFHLAVGAVDTVGDEDDNTNTKRSSESGEIEKEKSRKERFYRALYSTLSEPAMLGTGKHLTMYFNLLYKAMKYDTDTSRLVAFAKRILCTALHCSSNVSAACIFLINEVGKTHPILMTCYQEVLSGPDALRVLDPTKREPRGAIVSTSDGKFSHEDEEKRAPGWELSLSMHHFHPSVQKFASSMGEENNYSGDPLKDFALAPFLDKFAYRNPKSVERVAGKYRRRQSIAERRSGTDSMIQSHFSLPVNDPSFLEKPDVDVQDQFFHQFFVEKAKRDESKGIVGHAAKSDSQDANKAEDERELDALDQEEAVVIDHDQPFDEYENQWETDEEEEAFVDSLAQKIIEDAIHVYDPDDLDDEDPDMEGWDDMFDEDDEENEKNGAEEEEEGESSQEEKDANNDDDDDAFMDDDDDDDTSSDDEDASAEMETEQPFLMDKASSSDDDGGEEGEDRISSDDGGNGDDDEEEDIQNDLAFVDDEDSSDDEKAPQLVQLPVDVSGTYAAAEDYEEIISKSWNSRKRPQIELNSQDDESDMEQEMRSKSATKKKKKRRKQKRHST